MTDKCKMCDRVAELEKQLQEAKQTVCDICKLDKRRLGMEINCGLCRYGAGQEAE